MITILIAVAAVVVVSVAAQQVQAQASRRPPAGSSAGIRAATDPAGDAMRDVMNEVRNPRVGRAQLIRRFDPLATNPAGLPAGKIPPQPPLPPGVFRL